ncbi:hypothetical protein BD779DRAFT_460254 [Infundibulicybe gibba]|nr:hypothetical protein BD779DRAFT_460254 [Infundibulicybe gibba]
MLEHDRPGPMMSDPLSSFLLLPLRFSSPRAAPETRMLDILRLIVVSTLSRPNPSPPARRAVSDFPPEILEKIFLHCLLPGWGSYSPRDAPLLLIRVCRSWREVAVSTPLLWSRLPPLQEKYSQYGNLQLFKLYLKYSASAALSIRLEFLQRFDSAPSLLLITPHLSQFQHLSIVHDVDIYGLSEEPTPITHFPRLKTLELEPLYPPVAIYATIEMLQGQLMIVGLDGIIFPWNQLTQLTIRFYNTTETLTLLRNCSSLEIFLLRSSWRVPGTLHTSPEPNAVLHHRLRTISLKMILAIPAVWWDCLITL